MTEGINDDLRQAVLSETIFLKFRQFAGKRARTFRENIREVLDTVDNSQIFLLSDDKNEGNLKAPIRNIVPAQFSSLLSGCIGGYAKCVNDLFLLEYNVDEKAKFFIKLSC